MNWDDHTLSISCFSEYVMTAADSLKLPAIRFKQLAEIFSGNLLHTATSRI